MKSMAGIPEMRIGILIGSLEVGGAQTMALRLLKLLMHRGHKVFLFTMDKDFEAQIPGDEKTRQEISKRILSLSQNQVRQGTLSKSVSAVRIYFKLLSLVRKNRIDVMLSFMERANIINLLLPSEKMKKIISVRIHIQRLFQKTMLKQWMIKTLYPFLLKRADKINFNSIESSESFRKIFPIDRKKISVIYNFCDADLLEKKSLETPEWEYNYLFDRPVIISSGRLVRQKGHVHLIRAFAELCKTNHDVMLLIIGEGPLLRSLNELCLVLGIKDRVIITGFQKNLMGCIRKAAFFVLPSYVEGFPNALLEAMAIGLPVISADCSSGPRELLAPGTGPELKTKCVDFAAYGVLIPPFNKTIISETAPLLFAEDQLYQAMHILMENTQIRDKYRRVGRLRARMFSEEKMEQKWIDLFKNKMIGTRNKALI